MHNINWRKEIGFAGAAAIVAFLVAALVRSNGTGKWLTAGARGASGAIGGLAAAAVIA